MRLILAFFVLATIPTTALACLTASEPGFYRMIKNSTLIVRGQVLRDTEDNRGIGLLEQKHLSDVRVERVYKGTAPQIIRVGWKEYSRGMENELRHAEAETPPVTHSCAVLHLRNKSRAASFYQTL